MSNNSSGGTYFGVILFLGLIVLGFMWALDLGPFEKSYTPTTPYYAPVNSGSNPSFTGGQYKCRGTNCYCPIKRSELEAAGLNMCSCGHPTTLHHD